MKVWELDFTPGKQYRAGGDIRWTVKNGGLVRIAEGCEFEISEDYYLEDLLKLEFTEVVVDWSKVVMDTPIMVSEYGPHNWCRRYFAYYDDKEDIVYAFNDGCTEWSSQGITTGWKYFKLV